MWATYTLSIRKLYKVYATNRRGFHFTISLVQKVLAWLAKTHDIVKQRVPLYDSACAESATPAIKNGPDRKVGELFLRKRILEINSSKKTSPLYDLVRF